MDFLNMPEWLSFLLQGLAIFAMLAASAVVATKAGKSPYYALFFLFPFLQIVFVWIFALQEWPKIDKKGD